MHRHFSRIPASLTLSIEEEAIATDEANQQIQAVDDTITETERLGDIIVSMGDVETVVSNTPEIGTVEESLIAAVSDMAVAGTDADPEQVEQDLLPATADEQGEALSAEAFSDNVKAALIKIWDTVKAAVLQAWELIKGFFQKIQQFFAGTTRRIAKLEAMMKAAKVSGNVPLDKELTFHGSSRWLTFYGVHESHQSIAQGYIDASATAKGVFEVIVEAAEEMMEKIGDVGSILFMIDKSRNFYQIISQQAGKAVRNVAAAAGLKNPTLGREFESDDRVMGGLIITGYLPAGAETYGESPTERFSQVNHMSLDIRVNHRQTIGHAVKIPLTGKVADIDLILRRAQDWVKTVEGKQSALSGLVSKANKATQDIERSLKQGATTDRVSEENFSQWQSDTKAMLMLISKVSSIVTRVTGKIVNHNTNVSNAALDYAIESYHACVKAHGGEVDKVNAPA